MKVSTNSKRETKKNKKDTIEIKLSGLFSNKKIVFHNDFLEYKDKNIPYVDIRGVSYMAISTSINFIPLGTERKFTLTTEKDEISLSVKEDEWIELINISKQIIEPILIQKITKDIFEKNHEYEIGGAIFNKYGYYKNKFFGGSEEVSWSNNIFTPQYSEGNVILFKEKNGEGRHFKTISMSEENAVILPELIEACLYLHNYYKSRKK